MPLLLHSLDVRPGCRRAIRGHLGHVWTLRLGHSLRRRSRIGVDVVCWCRWKKAPPAGPPASSWYVYGVGVDGRRHRGLLQDASVGANGRKHRRFVLRRLSIVVVVRAGRRDRRRFIYGHASRLDVHPWQGPPRRGAHGLRRRVYSAISWLFVRLLWGALCVVAPGRWRHP